MSITIQISLKKEEEIMFAKARSADKSLPEDHTGAAKEIFLAAVKEKLKSITVDTQ